MKKKIALLFCASLLLTGCGKIPKLENGKEAVVSYKDGTLISVDDLYAEMKDSYAMQVLVDMIDKNIYEKEYKDKISEAKKDAEDQLADTKKQFVDDDGNYDEESLLNALRQYMGLSSIEAYKNLLYLNYYRNLVVDDYAKSLITDKEIEKYYKDEIVGDISCKHILITADVKDNMSSTEKAKAEEEALKKAQEIINKLKNYKGKDLETEFSKLAKEYSKDSSNASKGGDLGYFNKGDMLSEFETAAYKLKVGSYTATPVKTKYGYHIILKTGEKEKETLDKVKDKIIKALCEDKVNNDATVQVNALTNMRKKYGVKIEDSKINSQYNQLMNYNLNAAKQQNEASKK